MPRLIHTRAHRVAQPDASTGRRRCNRLPYLNRSFSAKNLGGARRRSALARSCRAPTGSDQRAEARIVQIGEPLLIVLISGSFAENDLHLKASYASLPPCTSTTSTLAHEQTHTDNTAQPNLRRMLAHSTRCMTLHMCRTFICEP